MQQRLDHSLNDVVTDVVLDLEHLLEDQDRAITMLRRTRNVLEQLGHLGAPREELDALLAQCRRPEALPSTAKATHKLIRRALDDIHLEADQRDAGEAVAGANGSGVGRTADATRSSGLDCRHAARPPLDLHVKRAASFRSTQRAGRSPPVEPANEATPEVTAPSPHVEAEAVVEETAPRPASAATTAINDEEERRMIDAELASLDAERSPHVRLADLKASADPALEALEARLGDIDL